MLQLNASFKLKVSIEKFCEDNELTLVNSELDVDTQYCLLSDGFNYYDARIYNGHIFITEAN